MSGNHPTFPNPAVAEALCELHFSPRESVPWKVFSSTLTERFEDYLRQHAD